MRSPFVTVWAKCAAGPGYVQIANACSCGACVLGHRRQRFNPIEAIWFALGQYGLAEVGVARRSGARVDFLRLDEPASRGLFVFINVSSGSCRRIRGSHEPNDPRGGNAHPKAGSRWKTFFKSVFFRLRGFLFLRVRKDGQYEPGNPACFCILDGPVWRSAAVFFCSAQ